MITEQPYKKRRLIISCIIFFVSVMLFVLNNNLLLLTVPFIFLLLPFFFNYTVTATENIFWLMIFFLPLSTELNVTETLGLDFPDEPLLILLTGFFFAKWLHQPRVIPGSLLKNKLFILIVLQLLWILITCVFSVNPLLSFKFFLAKIWYVVPFVILVQIVISSKTDLLKLALLLLLPMLFVVMQAIIRHSFYLFSFEGIKQTLYPFFRNHVNYSAMLVCLLAVIWCIKKLTAVSNPFYKWINAGLVAGVVAVLLSFSRGAWLALLMGILAVYLIKRKWIVHFWITIICVLIGFFSWLMYHNHYLQFAPDHDRTIFHTAFSEHLKATVALKDVSNAERFYRWVAGINMIAAKPITGFGPNNFYDNYKNYSQSIFKTWVSNNPDHSTVHNYFLFVALEQGIPGLIIFVAILLYVFITLQQLYFTIQSKFYRQVCLSIVSILMMITTVIFLSDLIETDKIGSLFWLCMGLTIWLQSKAEEEKTAIAVI